ncbi:MAG: dTDP-4-dehydrorhamnose reductase [Acidobacteriota bacterium]|nr:dTDP-4-dehydrorhamnose reductase [Acidobacteriota bacterium]
MRVLVTGAAGQLGRAIVRRFSASASVTALTRQDLDIVVEADVSRVMTAVLPDVVVNCSAYNAVDQAEDDPSEALAANAFGVLALAGAARDCGAILVHYGTDFVFDGSADAPYSEVDAPNPASNYGLSKLLGEWFAADAPAHYVLRVESLFGGERAKSSIDRILDGIRRDEVVRVFADRTVTPSYVEDVAAATMRMVETRAPYGVYHCVNSGVTTWDAIAEEAARLLGRETLLERVSADSVPMRARRPKYCALSNEKLWRAGIGMPPWHEALARYIGSGSSRSFPGGSRSDD